MLDRLQSIVRFALRMLLFATSLTVASGNLDAEELRKSASWNWPDVKNFEEQLLSYLDQRQADESLREQVESSWSQTADQQRGPNFLARLLQVSSLVEPRIEDIRKRLDDATQLPAHPREFEWLSTDLPGWLQDTVRLACGRAFAQRRMYDEALETLSGLELIQVCDPASLIFYRATCEHHLMKREECLANIELLLQREDQLPIRYAQIANLMKADIENLEENSLDEVSRLMRDVERRLDLGRAGKRVRDEEQEIVDKLDKMIEQIEQQMQQQQQQQQQQQNQGNQQQSQQNPMEESQAAGGSGPGDVDDRDRGKRAGWGNLPPAQRQESLQRLTEELPSHYREVIEGYFRQLAKEKN